jgi:hypothetical protein
VRAPPPPLFFLARVYFFLSLPAREFARSYWITDGKGRFADADLVRVWQERNVHGVPNASTVTRALKAPDAPATPIRKCKFYGEGMH